MHMCVCATGITSGREWECVGSEWDRESGGVRVIE